MSKKYEQVQVLQPRIQAMGSVKSFSQIGLQTLL